MSDSSKPGSETLTEQAYEQMRDGRIEEAVETFSASIAITPREPNTLRGRGLAYAQLKQWSSAAADFEAAKTLAPDVADNWVDLGMSLAMDHQMYPAIDVLEALLARQPEYVRGHLELGRLHITLGAITKGRQQLQKALTCRPTLSERHLIESVLQEQTRLDRKRLYRPDFGALHQQRVGRGVHWMQRFRALFKRTRKDSTQV